MSPVTLWQRSSPGRALADWGARPGAGLSTIRSGAPGSLVSLAAALLLCAAGCSDTGSTSSDGTGGAAAAAGGSSAGGVGQGAQGGNVPASGGGSSGGGVSVSGGSGGSVSTGGADPGTGGAAGLGGTPAGGVQNSGGATTGGSASGGTSSGGTGAGGEITGGASTGGSSTGGEGTGGEGTGGEPTTVCDFGSLTEFNDSDGSATYYDPANEVNCSFPMNGSNVEHVATGDGAFIVAMGPSEYGGSAVCGACIEVTRDNGATVTVTASDSCPGCQAGHIDLSRAAFMQIGTEQEGYLGTKNGGSAGLISWRYVPCPVQGNIIIRLKEPTNDGWNEFLVMNTRLPVAKLEANWEGAWVAGTRQTYNYFNVGASLYFPLRIRVTDVAGNSVQGMIMSGVAEQELDGQFLACR